MTIRCEIVSQDRLVFEGDADIVVIPGSGGEMGILPNHAPLLSTLEIGTIRVRHAGQEEIQELGINEQVNQSIEFIVFQGVAQP